MTWDADPEANFILQELEKERVQEEGLAKNFPVFGPGDSLELKLVCTYPHFPHSPNSQPPLAASSSLQPVE